MSAGWPPLADLRAHFQRAITDALAEGAIGLKTIAAYRCGLDLPVPSVDAATGVYERWRRSGSRRLSDARLVSLFVADASRPPATVYPFKCTLVSATPTRCWPWLTRPCSSATSTVACSSATRSSCSTAIPLCVTWATSPASTPTSTSTCRSPSPWSRTVGPYLVAEALELAPPNKLLFATDASRLPEMFLLGTLWWRESLARALGRLVDAHAALTRPMWLNAWGKLPSSSPVVGSTSSASSPTSLT